jgi:hypothetical protein
VSLVPKDRAYVCEELGVWHFSRDLLQSVSSNWSVLELAEIELSDRGESHPGAKLSPTSALSKRKRPPGNPTAEE